MKNTTGEHWDSLVPSREDIAKSRRVPDTPQTRSPAYRLAFDDSEFLSSEALRPIRLQLELLKTEMRLAAVEHIQRFLNGLAYLAPGFKVDVVAVFPCRFDGFFQRREI